MHGDPTLALLTLVLEACFGYPTCIFNRIAHPVVWMGALISQLDRTFNRSTDRPGMRKTLGALSLLVLLLSAASLALAVERMALLLPRGELLSVVIATSGLAQRSLYVHVRQVHVALETQSLAHARARLALIVGRDTDCLSDQEVAAAALESLAESFNDAVVAPTFWLIVGGLPGLFVYKAVNTADSMIGHLEERWRMFGWASARLDDVLNFVPARVAGVLLATAARKGYSIMFADAHKHASPNAGWPEAALAGALSVQLGGAATYDGVAYQRPTFGRGPLPNSATLRKGLQIYVCACALLWALLGIALIGSRGT